MSIIAGIIRRNGQAPLPDAVCQELNRVISRHPGEAVAGYRDSGACLAQVDVGALGAPAYRFEAGRAASVLAGEPLLAVDPEPAAERNRAQDLELLHADWRDSRWGSLARCRGTYCAAHYDAASGALTLIADKLSARPLYYWIGPEYVVFASALRILRSLDFVPKEMDLRGVTEIVCFGFPLAERTPFAGIAALQAGEMVQVAGQQVSRSRYWRWDRSPERAPRPDDLAPLLYDRFLQAVERRRHGDRVTAAFLSGGLDSRVIVSALRTLGATVHTLNFAPPGTQDLVFGAEAAKALGTVHLQLEMKAEPFEDTLRRARSAWEESAAYRGSPPERPRVIWSGDGGSVGLGGVMLNREMIELARAGARAKATDAFLRHNKIGVPERLLRRRPAPALARVPAEGMMRELADLECDDPGRAPHLFLMHNNETRRIADRYENIDLHRTELAMPFLDADFLEPVLTARVDRLLGHELYMEWLSRFPAAVVSVPWQTYPGHLPCHLPIPREMRYQWSRQFFDRAMQADLRRRKQQQADALLRSDVFPHCIIDRTRLRIAAWLTRLGIRDYSYVITGAATYCAYWQATGGRCSDPLLAAGQLPGDP